MPFSEATSERAKVMPRETRLQAEGRYAARKFRSTYAELAWRYRLRADQAQRSGFGDVLMTVDEARLLSELLDDAGRAIEVAIEMGASA